MYCNEERNVVGYRELVQPCTLFNIYTLIGIAHNSSSAGRKLLFESRRRLIVFIRRYSNAARFYTPSSLLYTATWRKESVEKCAFVRQPLPGMCICMHKAQSKLQNIWLQQKNLCLECKYAEDCTGVKVHVLKYYRRRSVNTLKSSTGAAAFGIR